MIEYADDTTVYVKSKSVEDLSAELESLASVMVHNCNKNGLIASCQRTQVLTTSRVKIKVKINHETAIYHPTINLLGLEYATIFSNAPYL